MFYETVGVDGGNTLIKVAGKRGIFCIPSDIGEYRTRNLIQTHGPDDIEFEYEGRRGFAGTLAQYESEFSGSIMGDTKAHEDTVLRVLIGLWRYSNGETNGKYRIVVGQPISRHTTEEKAKIKQMLQRDHTIEINGITHRFNIDRVEVAAEAGAAFWSSPQPGLLRIVDVGSATVNCATLIDGRYVDRDSFTLPFGVKSTKSNDYSALTRAIATEALKKWRQVDKVLLVGGSATDLINEVSRYFRNTSVMMSSLYANASGFYKIGRKLYGEGN